MLLLALLTLGACFGENTAFKSASDYVLPGMFVYEEGTKSTETGEKLILRVFYNGLAKDKAKEFNEYLAAAYKGGNDFTHFVPSKDMEYGRKGLCRLGTRLGPSCSIYAEGFEVRYDIKENPKGGLGNYVSREEGLARLQELRTALGENDIFFCPKTTYLAGDCIPVLVGFPAS